MIKVPGKDLIVILGPTASGKTKLAAALADRLDAEIISADSRQVYRDMTIGTGKDYADYVMNDKKIPYHLIDIADAGSKYNLHQYISDFNTCYTDCVGRGKQAILCGGSGLYIQAILKNYAFTGAPVNDPFRADMETKTHEEIIQIFRDLPHTPYTNLADLSTKKRSIRAIEINTWLKDHAPATPIGMAFTPVVFGLNPEVAARRENIRLRLFNRIQNGLIEEVEHLLKRGIPASDLEYYGLEYKHITQYLTGKESLSNMQEKLTIAIQQFAKRQMTFFRKMEREGIKINWFNPSLTLEQQLQFIHSQLNR